MSLLNMCTYNFSIICCVHGKILVYVNFYYERQKMKQRIERDLAIGRKFYCTASMCHETAKPMT